MGGASLRPEDYDPRLNDFVLSLARRERPRVCFVGTASGDAPEYVANFYRAFSGHHDCVPSDLGLFSRTVADLRVVRAGAGRGVGGRREHGVAARGLADARARRACCARRGRRASCCAA